MTTDLLARLDTYRRCRTARGATLEELTLLEEVRAAVTQPRPAPAAVNLSDLSPRQAEAYLHSLTPCTCGDPTHHGPEVQP
ncbi:hypothetical protein [Deinococcus hohokamensis]|uniref:Uncharacterized protein n=1 Tax=Deinococcus hohokamensis TaxID=309883 RepID=A0ABV9IBX8_9DEIO